MSPALKTDIDRSVLPKCVRRCGLYLRISKDRDGDAEGVARQEKLGRRLAKQLDWAVIEVYRENDVSNSKFAHKKRVEYQRMLADLARGHIDAVIVYHSDRLVSQPKELEKLIELFESYDLDFRMIEGNIDLSTSGGILTARTLCNVADGERRSASRRYKSLHADIAEKGRPAGGGMRPFGYEPGGMKIRESEAELIRDAVRRVLAGQTVTGIATEWTGTVPTATGKSMLWPASNLRRILRSARIAGRREHYDHRLVQGRRVKKLIGVYGATWPAIITEDEHQRIRILIPDEVPTGEAPARVALLSGKIACGRPECLATARKLTAAKRNGKPGYSCQREGGCRRCGISREVADGWVKEGVIKALESRALTAENNRRAKAKASKGADPAAEVDKIKGKLAVLSRARFDDEEIDDDEYRAAREPLQAKLKAAQAKMVKVEPDGALAVAGVNVKTLRGEWDHMTLDKRRALIDSVVERITLLPGHLGAGNVGPDQRIVIDWKC